MPIIDQTENILRFAISFSILFLLVPVLIFREKGGGVEGFFSRYIKMAFVIIVIGYILAAIKLFESISIIFVLVLLIILNHYRERARTDSESSTPVPNRPPLLACFLQTFDGDAWSWIRSKVREALVKFMSWCNHLIINPYTLILIGVLCGAAYLRFYDPLIHAAPGYSDAPNNIAWVKYITMSDLFHDGIYPHGNHILLATWWKLAGDDILYTFKYSGALNGVLASLGIYLFISKLTGRKTAGIIGAFIYGILGQLLPLDWGRQAATLSQESALVFIIPCWYFAICYLEFKEKRYLWTASAAFATIGLIHTLIYALMVLGVILIILIYFLFNPQKNLGVNVHLMLAGIASAVISGIPMLYGLILGKSFHTTTFQFLVSTAVPTIPKLTHVDYAVLIGIIVMIILVLVNLIMRKKRIEPILFVVLLSILSYISYMYLGWWTGNAVIVTRIGILWAIVICLAIGFGWHAIVQILSIVIRPKLEILLCLFVLVATTAYYQPTLPAPYKMFSDNMVNQYLRVSREFIPTTWMMVSNEEGYWLSLYNAWHTHLWDFLEYSPETKVISKLNENGTNQKLESEDILIFIEKKVFDPDLEIKKKEIENRIKNYALIEEWIKTFSRFHDNIILYHEDDELKIYHIHQKLEDIEGN